MEHPTEVFEGREAKVLERLRALCLAFPEAFEVEQFGHPWFKVGKKPFAIFGRDKQRDTVTISFNVSKMDQEGLCAMDGFWPTPYLHQHGWTTMAAARPDWGVVEELLDTAYRRCATKTLVRRLDG